MDSCQICSNSISSDKLVTCSGTWGYFFHYACAGLSKSHYSSWSANIGLYWFCASCRLNFNPNVCDREKTIVKALRELLLRTDSMDTRLANYGEHLRKINMTLYGYQQRTSQTNRSHDNSTFHQQIDMLNLDDTIDNTVNRSRSCEETSFLEVLDEINTTVGQPTDKFIVGANKRVQIICNQPSPSTSKEHTNQSRASTPAASSQIPKTPISVSKSSNASNPNRNSVSNHPTGTTRTSSGPLSVANIGQPAADSVDFYVTPFTPDQKEEDVKLYIQEVANVAPSTIKVVKLVPRGKDLDDLSFVSFKVTVNKTASDVIGDPWYWPDGVTVRVFDHNQKNGSSIQRPPQP